MSEKIKLQLVLVFTLFYLLIFSALAIWRGNYEFLFYTLLLSKFLIIIALYHKKLHLSSSVVAGLSLVGFLHVMGGNVYIQSVKLYDFWLYEGIFKYDNFVHMVASFVVTVVVYSLIAPHLEKNVRHNLLLLGSIIVLAAVGVGALNEIAEFSAVVFLDAARAVGDYRNNALDLFFNLLGTIAATFLVIFYHQRLRERE